MVDIILADNDPIPLGHSHLDFKYLNSLVSILSYVRTAAKDLQSHSAYYAISHF